VFGGIDPSESKDLDQRIDRPKAREANGDQVSEIISDPFTNILFLGVKISQALQPESARERGVRSREVRKFPSL
jgi:hypothetical protein